MSILHRIGELPLIRANRPLKSLFHLELKIPKSLEPNTLVLTFVSRVLLTRKMIVSRNGPPPPTIACAFCHIHALLVPCRSLTTSQRVFGSIPCLIIVMVHNQTPGRVWASIVVFSTELMFRNLFPPPPISP